ncbi:hypothetical protein HMPREF0766_14110 [Sphingobacterium spiritivorum ATCC 33861]|uniref:Uncharacterized protein n=1 Tax=Sphingobacterium spiritivorum ATCC 33861 TaxID=525373 RepID=D7VT06_SPHSI|nr:hypothetical protein HMPREF0766_14110 [Sphingobacterium spiritivorum ATCC 33861]
MYAFPFIRFRLRKLYQQENADNIVLICYETQHLEICTIINKR